MNLESDKRLNIQLRLDFSSAPTGEARQAGGEDIESLSVTNEPERPADTRRIMEEVCERKNLKEALRQVRSNKGSAGVDGMTVDKLGDYLKQHWPVIREQLLNGIYKPKPVRRVEIPKPDGVLEQASAVVSHRIERVDPIFNHAINTLWAGNGTASLAVLGAISATPKMALSISGRSCRWLFFWRGLDLYVRRFTGHIASRERSNQANAGRFNAVDFQVSDVQSPVERAGLTFRNWRTLMALFAGGFFIVGCIVGFGLLLFA